MSPADRILRRLVSRPRNRVLLAILTLSALLATPAITDARAAVGL